MPMSVDLPAPFGPEQADDVAGAGRRTSTFADGAPPAEMARHVDQVDAVEIGGHAATPESPPSSAP